MNYHSDKWIMDRVQEHWKESLEHFPGDRVVGLFYQGSGNYGLDTENSDVDTKLVVVPSFEDIALNKPAVSTTHIRENDEHIDFKDLRLMLQTFKKQNVNFLEILFTKYLILNPMYENEWKTLIHIRESIAHYDPGRAIKAMAGQASQKYNSMYHRYEGKTETFDLYGYNPKDLHHLVRIEEYLERYIQGELFEDCLISKKGVFLNTLKSKEPPTAIEAGKIAEKAMAHILEMKEDPRNLDRVSGIPMFVDRALIDVQKEIIKKSLQTEFLKERIGFK